LRFKLPVKSSKLNVFIAILGIGSPFSACLPSRTTKLTEAQHQWIAEQIFNNECNREVRCLTSWNPGEDFPSLGLGHFIWYRAGQAEIYSETFPELMHFYQIHEIETPTWITALPGLDSPWQTREQFYAEIDQPRLTELRDFLSQTLPIQARFIIERQQGALSGILERLPRSQRTAIETLYHRIAAADPPYGRYALIDYVNFKGEGTSPAERYQGQGWGLLQVLQEMLAHPDDQAVLVRFSEAAARVLQRRVANAPVERNEQRWLTGWLNRLQTYLPTERRRSL
jgi:hypothetical protein